ncbi:MAG: 1,4-dihydroxy-2-naphthoate polyprenyltransferase [Melioribacteraceae bacterium]|nr:MAG: 1,4-dihydroxy-2-naphthoate polyprenyltransferase [Melioribacteraceae bacterium]
MLNSEVKNISKFESWILASRPKTLLAAAVPVVIGTSIAVREDQHNLLAAVVALLCSVLIQIGTNFVNDLYDHLAGSDTEERVGPLRALASGLISVPEMKYGILFTFGIAFLSGLYLVYMTSWITLVIGIVSILAGYAYTAGPYPLAYNGLGDIFVFVFFGFVGTVGTYYVQAGDVSALSFWASVPVGALVTNILVVNNYRDIEQDQVAGKRTLAVKFGKGFTRIQYLLFMIVSYLVPFVVYFTYYSSIIVFLPLLSLPLAIRLIRMIYTLKGTELNKTLELTAKLSLIYGILFSFGVLI